MSVGSPAVKKNCSGKRCGHHYCSDCKTRRGNNRGNRRIRHYVKTLLRKRREDDL